MLSLAIFLVSVTCLALLLDWLWEWYLPRWQGLPPRPFGLPIVGNVDLMTGMERHRKIEKFGKQFGGIFSAKVGTARSVFVTSYKLFREAMIENTWEFAGRPDAFWKEERPVNHLGIVASGVDEASRQVRKFTLVSLRSLGFGKNSMQEAILRESADLNEELRKFSGKSFNPRNKVAVAVANIIASISLGKAFKQGDERLELVFEAISVAMKQAISASRDQMFPILRYLPGSGQVVQSRMANSAPMTLIREVIAEHQATREPGSPRDYIDVWLDEQAKSEKSGQDFPLERLPQVVLDMFAGGLDTSTTTLQWIFIMMLHNPEVQEKIYQEIDQKVGSFNQITLDDREALPYTEAAILETIRLYPAGPLGVPHKATEDARLGKYLVPKGTQVLLHIYAIQRDPDFWPNAAAFQPERFIRNGVLKTPDQFIAFGAGRRSCPGEQMARRQLFLLFANFMRCFRIVLPEGDALPSLDLMDGMVVYPRPFNIVLKER